MKSGDKEPIKNALTNVTILGLGKTGHATALYLSRRNTNVLVSESTQLVGANRHYADDLIEHNVTVEQGGHSEEALKSADLIVTSPGIPPNAEVMQRAYNLNKPVVGDIELAFRESTIPMVAVTGTNGKSTTTALISFMLEHNGKKAPSCGNFGLPVLSALEQSPDYLIVETSSFQLHYCHQFAPLVSVWLNLTPDHLSWHGDINAYIADKQKLFAKQNKDQFAVLNHDDIIVASTKTAAQIIPFSQVSDLAKFPNAAFLQGESLCYRQAGEIKAVLRADEMAVIGSHNIENALAAIAVGVVLGLKQEQIADALRSFKGLAHRLEYVETIDGVRCYNDSKATNPDSAVKALLSFKEKVVLIAGGRDKGTDLSEFVKCVSEHTSAVILLGEAKERFSKAFREGGVENIYFVGSLDEGVQLGLQLKSGPLVLSPACASYDMFRDFEDRGNVFKDIVRSRSKKVAASAP